LQRFDPNRVIRNFNEKLEIDESSDGEPEHMTTKRRGAIIISA